MDGQPLAVHLSVPAAQLIGLGVTQLPLPLQVGAAVNWEELAGQEALPQLVPLARCWQPLAPLQKPVLPQVEVTVHWPDGAAWPEAMGAQVPLAVRLHDSQVPQALLVQQTPSVQKPLPHSLLTAQVAPSAFLGLQEPAEQ
jgi:hypothetical protein